MKQTNEQQFDALISASFERQELLQDINTAVMADIKHSARRAALRRWVRLGAFAFGLPLVLLCFGWGIRYVCTVAIMQPVVVIGLMLSVVSMIAFSIQTVRNFQV